VFSQRKAFKVVALLGQFRPFRELSPQLDSHPLLRKQLDKLKTRSQPCATAKHRALKTNLLILDTLLVVQMGQLQQLPAVAVHATAAET